MANVKNIEMKDKNSSFEQRYKSHKIAPEVRAFAEYFYKEEIKQENFKPLESIYFLGNSDYIIVYPYDEDWLNCKNSQIQLSRKFRLRRLFDYITKLVKPNSWYNLSDFIKDEILAQKYLRVTHDILHHKLRKPAFFETDKLKKTIDFIRKFLKDKIVQMYLVERNHSFIFYFRLSKRYFIGLRQTHIDFKENPTKIDFDDFISPAINQNLSYLFYWTEYQLKNYINDNRIVIKTKYNKFEAIEAIQNFKPTKKPRLLFVQRLFEYPLILENIITHFNKRLIKYKNEWINQIDVEEASKKYTKFEKAVFDHIMEHQKDDYFMSLFESDLNLIYEELKEYISTNYSDLSDVIFPQPPSMIKLSRTELYEYFSKDFDGLEFSTIEFKNTRNIGRIGECYICYNVLVWELIQKYPDAIVDHKSNESGFRIVANEKEIANVKWLNQKHESYENYDIYLEENGIRKYIEVKASKNDEIKFDITQSELDFAIAKEDAYQLYFVGSVKGDIHHYKFENFTRNYKNKSFEIKAYRIRYNSSI